MTPNIRWLALLGLSFTAACGPTSTTPPGGDDDDATADDDDATAAGCVGNEDSLEDNDDASQAVVVAPGDSYDGLWACPSDLDYFSFTAPADGELIASISFINDEGDIDLHLEADDGSNIANSASFNDTETITQFISAGTTVYVQVEAEFRDDDVPGNSYDITFEQN